jgi:hypothetical protein
MAVHSLFRETAFDRTCAPQVGEKAGRPRALLDLSFRISDALAPLLYRHHTGAEIFVFPENLSSAMHLIGKPGHAPLGLTYLVLTLAASVGPGLINMPCHGKSPWLGSS